MKRTYATRRDARSAQAERTAAVGRLERWASAPEQDGDTVARDVRVLLEECRRLADLVPAVELLRADAKILAASVGAFRSENARLRSLVGGGG